MPQYFFVQSSRPTKYFACTSDQSGLGAGVGTATNELGAWTTTAPTTKSFNTGETGAREQIDVKLNFGGLYTNNDNAQSHNVEFQVTLMGCDTHNGTFVSQGSTYTKNVIPSAGTIVQSNSEDVFDTGDGTIATDTFNFMTKKKFFFVQVKMVVSAYIRKGITYGVNIYGAVAVHDDGIIRRKYKTKTFMHGAGLQVMSGPKSYARFGRNQNLIFGNLNVEGDTEGGGGGYFEKNLTVGTNETFTTHPLYVVGDIAATGNVIAYVSSDERLKTAITPLENSLEKVKRLNPVDFAWKSRDVGWGTESPADMGLLAQDVEKQFPTIVKEMKDGYKGIRYDRLIPVLVDCIKTQDSKIEELKELVEKMIDKSKEE